MRLAGFSIHPLTSGVFGRPDLGRHFDVLLQDGEVGVELPVVGLQHLEAGVHGLVQGLVVVRRRLPDALELLPLQLPQVVVPAVGELAQKSPDKGHHQRGTCTGGRHGSDGWCLCVTENTQV